MEMHAPHKDRSLEPIDNFSLEDLEKEIQSLRSYAARSELPPAVRPPDQAQRKRVLNVRHGSQPEEGQDSNEGDISFNFAKAESQIKGIKDELLNDYPADMGFQKSGKMWDYSDHFPEIKSNLENKGKFLAAKSASKYPVEWTYNKAILQYQFPEFKASPWQFPRNSIRSQFKGYILKDDKTSSNSGGRFPEGTDASEFQSQMSGAALTKGNAEQSPQMKSGLFSDVVNSFDMDGKMDEYNNRGYKTNNALKHQGNIPNSPSSNVTEIEDSNIAFLRKMKLKMNYPKNPNKKGDNTDGTIPIPVKNIDENNEYPGTLHADNAGNLLRGVNKATNNRQIAPKIATKHNIEISLEVGQPATEIHKSLDLSKKPHIALPLFLNEDIKERTEDKNKVVRNRNVGKMRKSEADKVWDSIFETKHKVVAAPGYKTNKVPHAKHATRNYARELSFGPEDLVNVEKRKGNSAARYRDRPKSHRKYVPRPQYRPKPTRKPQVTTTSTTTVDQSNATIYNKSNATLLRGNRTTGKGHGPTTEYMAEIIDSGSDKVDIPLSGSDWYDRIHGHRDIILAGAIMGGIGLLLIILSIAYMFINRRKMHQQQANKSNNKEYRKLGSTDEKVGLTKPQHSLFPLSSEESTTEESEDESKHSRTNVAATY